MDFRLRGLAVATALGLALTVGSASAASAVDPGAAGGSTTQSEQKATDIPAYSVTRGSTVRNQILFSKLIGSCLIGLSGSTCTVTKGKDATRSIDLSLGITRGAVASGLGIGSSNSVSVSVGCTSPALPQGTQYKAYAMGTQYYYKVNRWYVDDFGRTSNRTTSGTLLAEDPYQTQIYCTK